MKASELISLLGDMIERHGDQEVLGTFEGTCCDLTSDAVFFADVKVHHQDCYPTGIYISADYDELGNIKKEIALPGGG